MVAEDRVPECRYEGDRREAVAAAMAAQSTLSADEGRPISLFHFRDALTVSNPLICQVKLSQMSKCANYNLSLAML